MQVEYFLYVIVHFLLTVAAETTSSKNIKHTIFSRFPLLINPKKLLRNHSRTFRRLYSGGDRGVEPV